MTDLHSHSVTAYPTVGGGTWSATLNLSTFTDGDPILYHASVTDENTNLTEIDRTGLKDTPSPDPQHPGHTPGPRQQRLGGRRLGHQ